MIINSLITLVLLILLFDKTYKLINLIIGQMSKFNNILISCTTLVEINIKHIDSARLIFIIKILKL